MKEFKCEICEKLFKTKVSLRNHFNYIHNISGKAHKCNVCTTSFQTLSSLTSHVKSAHGAVGVGKKYDWKNDNECSATKCTLEQINIKKVGSSEFTISLFFIWSVRGMKIKYRQTSALLKYH